ncbi:hypothetical protein A6764_00035 [Brevibacillus sp. WF146]|uniref:hypothetical protein n=1 Tax=Brevibacillus sp. WF146 TaxID=319501 RepID=UPI0007EC9DC4|nr:hypothetical protein [Brevibacillus sp. WF146]UYZ12185.1 hypothetical protein A6764_15280 [Brevibacillus sp. WF146]UYZ13434.1 hypothetical protein A6764_00035 [Brevibacillus sp. WF146]
MSETKRDLNVDLAICNAATSGPWAADKGYEQSERGNYVYSQADGSVVCAEQDDTDCVLTDTDARFIAEARTGWPHAIERALAAEKRVAELEARLACIEEKRAKAREQFEALRKKLRKCCVCGRPFVAIDPEEFACSPWCGEHLTEGATADDQTE